MDQTTATRLTAVAAAVVVVMCVFQTHLDRTRSISVHCLLRNVLVCCGAYLVATRRLRLRTLIAGVLVVEVLIDALHQIGYTLDPYINKTLNFWSGRAVVGALRGHRWADTLWGSRRMRRRNFYSEGRHDCDAHHDLPEAERAKYDWMMREGRVVAGSHVLEVGCGNGEFMRHVRARGANIVGITPSSVQVALLRGAGLDARCIDLWDLPKHPELHGVFDVVVLNGPTEHFLTIDRQDDEARHFRRVFRLVALCLNRRAGRRPRCVITAIHRHRPFSAFEYLQVYLLERTYGGYYAADPDAYVRYAAPQFRCVTQENHTMDYYIYSRKIWYHVYRGLTEPATLLRMLVDVPVFLCNDPYYLHKVLHCLLGTWAWQFEIPMFPPLAADHTPPMLHQWLTLELTHDQLSPVGAA